MNEAEHLTLLIVLAALLTFGTRVGGHLLMTRFTRLGFRTEAALNAVPVAVLSALVAPAAIAYGWAETTALLVASLVALRFSSLWVIGISLAVLVGLRQLG